MEQSPSTEANSHSAGKAIPRYVHNQNSQYRVYNSPLLYPILSHINPVHAYVSQFSRFILILSSHVGLGLLNGHFYPGSPTEFLFAFLVCPMRPIFFDRLIPHVPISAWMG